MTIPDLKMGVSPMVEMFRVKIDLSTLWEPNLENAGSEVFSILHSSAVYLEIVISQTMTDANLFSEHLS